MVDEHREGRSHETAVRVPHEGVPGANARRIRRADTSAAPGAARRPVPRASIARVLAGRLLALAALTGAAPCVVRAQTPDAQTPDAQAERRRIEEERVHADWAYLARYRDENARLGPPRAGEQRVVFMGNSITQGWAPHFAAMFPGKPYVGRGISGQTTPQMLVRFPQDVIALRPSVVVILAGVNDLAGNTGPSTLEMIQDNLAAMVALAHAHGIRVVLSSVLPAADFPWKPGMQPAPRIVALNAWMRDHAAAHGAVYLDYHSAMRDERQGMRAELAYDGVHPTEAGYRLMAPLVERAIAEALRRPAPARAGGRR